MKRRLSTLVLLGVLAACGSADKDATPTSDSSDPAEQPAEPAASADADTSAETDEASVPPATTNNNSDSDDPVVIIEIDDLPAECRQIMSDFLREIEPIVTAIDWENATMGSLEQFDTTFTEPSDRLDAAMEASGCDQYEFGPETDSGMAFTIELARVEAPGVIGWLEFIRDLDNPGDTVDSVPTDCEGAIAFATELIAESSGISELPLTQLAGVTSVMSTIQSDCAPEQATAFFEDPAFQAWSEN